MTDTAAAQLSRIVTLVAELTRRDKAGLPASSLEAIGASFRVPAATIARDIRTLTLLGDHAEADWLLSLCVWQQEGAIAVSSAGPFRRPVRLSPEESLALRVALAMDRDGARVAEKLADVATTDPGDVHLAAAGTESDYHNLAFYATSARRELELLYVGEGESAEQRWIVQPHQLVCWRGRNYLIAWSPDVGGWRHFRLDRMLEATLLETRFDRRADFVPVTDPENLFRPGASDAEQVTVRFSPKASGLARERYPDCTELPDGSVSVTLRASSMPWLLRRVLEFGDDAEVVEPAAYREAMRRAVA